MLTLGIHDGHNATAALMQDGQLLAAVSEEKMTYKKNDMGFPQNAINECLKITGVKPEKIDLVAFSTINLPLNYLRIKREYSFTIRDWLNEQEYYWKPKIFAGRINQEYLAKINEDERFKTPQTYSFDGIPYLLTDEENRFYLNKIRKGTLQKLYGIEPAKIREFRHHLCHQYYAYFGSPFRGEKTLIVTADGGGDGENGTVSIAENDKIRNIASNNCSDLARIYRYITLILGMKIGEHEYKVMGLAPYATNYEIKKCDKVFKDVFHVPDLLIEYKNRPPDLFFYFRDNLADCRFDGIAGGVQIMVEEVGGEWLKKLTTKLNLARVVFSGGLSQNVKLNKVIGELDSVKEFYITASGGDESLAIGACYAAQKIQGQDHFQSMEDNYLGPEPQQPEIEVALKKLTKYKITSPVTNTEIARLLSQNLVIARLKGRLEFGARALGNRSILANPANREMVRKINNKIKFRDFWMPFAPSILDSYADRYLINPKKFLSDHMTMAFDTTEEGREKLAAAIHSDDHTVRPQIVRRSTNPDYYDLIEEFAKITGIGAVLNTSFNLHGLPIVCNPQQAVQVFENSDLDGMVIGDYLIMRNERLCP